MGSMLRLVMLPAQVAKGISSSTMAPSWGLLADTNPAVAGSLLEPVVAAQQPVQAAGEDNYDHAAGDEAGVAAEARVGDVLPVEAGDGGGNSDDGRPYGEFFRDLVAASWMASARVPVIGCPPGCGGVGPQRAARFAS